MGSYLLLPLPRAGGASPSAARPSSMPSSTACSPSARLKAKRWRLWRGSLISASRLCGERFVVHRRKVEVPSD